MPLENTLIPAEDRLDLTVHGRLDLTLTPAITDLLRQLPAGLRTCIVDLTRVEQTFDSGLALLWLLEERLHRLGVTLVVLCEDPALLQQIPIVMRHASLTIPQDSPASDAASGRGTGGLERRPRRPRMAMAASYRRGPPSPRAYLS